jgi:hypothetical protein
MITQTIFGRLPNSLRKSFYALFKLREVSRYARQKWLEKGHSTRHMLGLTQRVTSGYSDITADMARVNKF